MSGLLVHGDQQTSDRSFLTVRFSGGSPLAQPGAGQHAEPDDTGGALLLVGGERIGQPADLLEGQEPLSGRLRALAEAGRRIVGAHLPKVSACPKPTSSIRVIRMFGASAGRWSG